MNFIPFSVFLELFPTWEKKDTSTRMLEITDFLHNQVEIKVKKQTWSLQEFSYFAELYQHSNYILFSAWIEEHKHLQSLLLGDKIAFSDFKIAKFNENLLFPDFKRFISPFLVSKLKLHVQEEKNLFLVFSYLPLLNEEQANYFQEIGGNFLHEEQGRFKTLISSATNQTDFNREIVLLIF
jgi:hypothetical protein